MSIAQSRFASLRCFHALGHLTVVHSCKLNSHLKKKENLQVLGQVCNGKHTGEIDGVSGGKMLSSVMLHNGEPSQVPNMIERPRALDPSCSQGRGIQAQGQEMTFQTSTSQSPTTT